MMNPRLAIAATLTIGALLAGCTPEPAPEPSPTPTQVTTTETPTPSPTPTTPSPEPPPTIFLRNYNMIQYLYIQ